MPRRHEKCFICEEFGMIEMRTPNRKPICRHCTYVMHKENCHKCQGKSHTYNDNKEVVCNSCFRELCVCVKCGAKRDGNKSPLMLCRKCLNRSKKERYKEKILERCGKPLETCKFCDKERVIDKTFNDLNICNSCYKGRGKTPQECSVCGKTRRVENWQDKKPVCKRCYKSPPKKCYECGQEKVIKKNTKVGPLCDNCYMKDKAKNDERFYVKQKLRTRLSQCLREWSITGKTKTSDEYGVNYTKIVEQLGSCPGNREDYHIDHIFPLIAFNFNDLRHIAIAFSPENHQWLKSEENLKKGDNYDKNKFKEFLDAKMREL